MTKFDNDYAEGAEIDVLRTDAFALVAEAAPLVEVREDNLHDASEALARCAAILKDAEAMRVRMTKPLLDHKKFLDGVFKESVAPVQELSDKLRAAITRYNTEREREREEKERLARAELMRRAKAREAENARLAEAIGVEPGSIPTLDLTNAVIVPPIETEVVTASGRVTARPITRVRVVDPDKVPRPWCQPDQKAIEAFVRAAVKDGGIEEAKRTVREVFHGGVEVEIEMTTVVNTD